MKKLVIAIDIDDVLAYNAAGFIEYSNKKWGTTHSVDDYEEGGFAKIWPSDLDDFELRVREYMLEIPKDYKHFEEALPVLRRLGEDYMLRVVTSRRSWMRDLTSDWLERHFPGVFSDEAIHFAGIWDQGVHSSRVHQTKADIIEQLDATYLIDDQLKHCLAVAANGRQTLLFGDYSWNQANDLPKGVVRVSDWQSVKKYFYG